MELSDTCSTQSSSRFRRLQRRPPMKELSGLKEDHILIMEGHSALSFVTNPLRRAAQYNGSADNSPFRHDRQD